MQVNVHVSQNGVGTKTPLLVTPFGEEGVIPDDLKGMGWRCLATAFTDDRLLRLQRRRIELEISCRGYSLLAS